MASMLKLKGVKNMVGKMRRVSTSLSGAAARGLKKGGRHLLRESMLIVPVQTGNLRGSSFIRVFGSGWKTDVQVGYTAGYAVFVHENLQKVHGKAFNIKYASEIEAAKGTKRGTARGGMIRRGEQQQAKFLEAPMKSERTEILKIIRDELQKGMKRVRR